MPRIPILAGLVGFVVVQSYPDAATKLGIDKFRVLRGLCTTGAWPGQNL